MAKVSTSARVQGPPKREWTWPLKEAVWPLPSLSNTHYHHSDPQAGMLPAGSSLSLTCHDIVGEGPGAISFLGAQAQRESMWLVRTAVF